MPLYEGETLKEAIQKAVRGDKTNRSDVQRSCQELSIEIGNIRSLVDAHLNHAQTLERQLESLKREAINTATSLVFDILAIGIPIARLARLSRILRAAENALRAYQASSARDKLLDALALIVEIIGVYRLIQDTIRLTEIPNEMTGTSRRIDELYREIDGQRQRLERVQNQFDQSACYLQEEGTPMM